METKRGQLTAQKAQSLMFSTALYLGKHAFPFRVMRKKDVTFFNLVLKRAVAEQLSEAVLFINKRDSWMSDTMQNEMIELFGRGIQEEIMHEVGKASFVGVLQMTDISGIEQMSICLQELEVRHGVHERFHEFL